MSSIAITIADAIVADLNGQTFSIDFTAARKLVPDHTMPELATLVVDVVPGPVTNGGDGSSREGLEEIIETTIGIRKRVSIADDSEAVAVIDLAEEVRVWLARRQLLGPALAGIKFLEVEQTQAYSPSDLREKHVVMSFLTVKHRGLRKVAAH